MRKAMALGFVFGLVTAPAASADPKGMVADGLSAPPHPAVEAFYIAKGWK